MIREGARKFVQKTVEVAFGGWEGVERRKRYARQLQLIEAAIAWERQGKPLIHSSEFSVNDFSGVTERLGRALYGQEPSMSDISPEEAKRKLDAVTLFHTQVYSLQTPEVSQKDA